MSDAPKPRRERALRAGTRLPRRAPSRQRASELEATLRAIREGAVDALLVRERAADKVVALKSFDELERLESDLQRETSARELAEKVRHEIESRFEAITKNAPVGVFLANPSGGCLYVNPTWCRLTGLSPAQASGGGWMKAVHAEDREQVLQELNRPAGATFQAEFRFARPDGTSVWVMARRDAIHDARGEITGYVGTIIDISERKRAELALVETNRKLQTVLDGSPLAILSIDRRGRILGWNRGAERLFGWSEQEALGRICPTVRDEDRKDFHDMIRRVLAGEAFRGRVRNRARKNGEVIRAGISAAPLLDAAGRSVGIVVMLDDVTERELANERLAKLVEDRERLVQDLHDNCIQSIYALGLKLEECRDVVGTDPEAASRRMEDIAADLNLVIQDLRLFIVENQGALGNSHDLKAVLERTLQLMGESSLQFQLDLDHEAADLLTSDQAINLAQIAREAISNAVRHAQAQSGRVSLRRLNGTLRLEVSDDGRGFDPAALDEPGLGLHHIEARARKIGARCAVDSAPGQGTRVVIELRAKKRR